MPLCLVQTNLPERDIPQNFVTDLSACVAKTLKKDESRVTVSLLPSLKMSRAGSSDPCVILEIQSFGVFDEERNKMYGPPLYKFMTEQLKLPAERVGILFKPIVVENIARPSVRD